MRALVFPSLALLWLAACGGPQVVRQARPNPFKKTTRFWCEPVDASHVQGTVSDGARRNDPRLVAPEHIDAEWVSRVVRQVAHLRDGCANAGDSDARGPYDVHVRATLERFNTYVVTGTSTGVPQTLPRVDLRLRVRITSTEEQPLDELILDVTRPNLTTALSAAAERLAEYLQERAGR